MFSSVFSDLRDEIFLFGHEFDMIPSLLLHSIIIIIIIVVVCVSSMICVLTKIQTFKLLVEVYNASITIELGCV